MVSAVGLVNAQGGKAILVSNDSPNTTTVKMPAVSGTLALTGQSYGFNYSGKINASTPYDGIEPTARWISISMFDVASTTFICAQLGYDGGFMSDGYNTVSSFVGDPAGTGAGQFSQGIGFYGYYQNPLSGHVKFEKLGDDGFFVGSGIATCHANVGVMTSSGRIGLGGSVTKPTNNYSVRLIATNGAGVSGSYSVLWY